MAATGFERRSVFSPLAARAAAEIAEEHGPALRRELPDGSIEVATLRKRRLYRHLVDRSGGSMLLDVAPPSPRQRRLRVLKWALGLAVVAGGLYLGAGIFAIFAGIAAGAGIERLGLPGGELRFRVAERAGDADAWEPVLRLRGWLPRTREQLRTAERLADDHDGRALVRSASDETVDAVVVRGGNAYRYTIDSAGNTTLVVVSYRRRREFVANVLAGIGIAIFGSFFVVAFLVHDELEKWSDGDLVALIAFAVMFVAFVVAALVSPSTDLRARARELGVADADGVVEGRPADADAEANDEDAWFIISRGGGDDGGDADGGDGGDGGD